MRSHRFDNRDRIRALDPAVASEAREIYRLMAQLEFPWDVAQALGFALFRTYAVPSIGELLFATGEFTERTQKRYDDTVLLMDAVLDHGPDHERGRSAVRRINRMHRAYAITNDDLLFVLCTFVVVPIRWIDARGWRVSTAQEREASAQVYRDLGRHLGITSMPSTYAGFAAWMDAFEADHFAYSDGAREVASATLDLLATFRPFNVAPPALTRRLSTALMDEPLLHAVGLSPPTRAERVLVSSLFRIRALVERLLPPRRRARPARELTSIRSYPRAQRATLPLDELGTFPGCPVDRPTGDDQARSTRNPAAWRSSGSAAGKTSVWRQNPWI